MNDTIQIILFLAVFFSAWYCAVLCQFINQPPGRKKEISYILPLVKDGG